MKLINMCLNETYNKYHILEYAIRLDVNAEKTKCMFLPCHQNAGQNHNIKTANLSFKRTVQFRCFGTTVTIQSLIQEEIKWRLNSGNPCYHSVKNILSSHPLSKNVKINSRTIILSVILYGCIKSRRMMWADHVAQMRAKRNTCSILMGKNRRKEATRKPWI
ncbi:hypothetical protein B7P43_G09917 [Cryptotermes secundus]|uniref:Reverse transcriptase domain-containing protein n=1 Tax=Cryptotermes secundus TaxID=105785 RepID=A0A2J7RDI0_9NEOP|nr:hypothetical protein B7P43_G09917 [Cryptotermes secundus]